MRRVTLLFLLTALVAAPPAAAKEIISVTACGPERCVTTDDEAVKAALMNGGTPSRPGGDAAGVVLLRASVGDGTGGEDELGSYMSAWEPRSRMLIFEDGTWMLLPGTQRAALADLAQGLETYPPSVLARLGRAEAELPVAKPGSAAPPPPTNPAPDAPAEAAAGTGWVLLVTLPAVALALGGVLLLRRRRPGGGAPRPAVH